MQGSYVVHTFIFTVCLYLLPLTNYVVPSARFCGVYYLYDWPAVSYSPIWPACLSHAARTILQDCLCCMGLLYPCLLYICMPTSLNIFFCCLPLTQRRKIQSAGSMHADSVYSALCWMGVFSLGDLPPSLASSYTCMPLLNMPSLSAACLGLPACFPLFSLELPTLFYFGACSEPASAWPLTVTHNCITGASLSKPRPQYMMAVRSLYTCMIMHEWNGIIHMSCMVHVTNGYRL